MCLLLLGLPTPSESRIIKEYGQEKAAAKNQKRKSQNRSGSKVASKRSREASSRGDVTFDDASAGRAEDTAAIGYMKSRARPKRPPPAPPARGPTGRTPAPKRPPPARHVWGPTGRTPADLV
jgi:hypothetical protein